MWVDEQATELELGLSATEKGGNGPRAGRTVIAVTRRILARYLPDGGRARYLARQLF